jgi:hypothetical protein
MPTPAVPVDTDPIEEEVVAGVEEEDGDNDDPEPEEEEAGAGEPSSSPQPPQMNRFQRRSNVFPNPLGAQMQPFMPQQGGVQVFPGQQEEPEAAEEGQEVAPGNPFGVPAGSTTTPGVVTPVPQPTPGSTNPRARRPPS